MPNVDPMKYDIVVRPKKFTPKGSPAWPVDAVLATADTGDAVKIPHERADPARRGQSYRSPRARLLNAISDGLKRRGYLMEWAAEGDDAVVVWAVRPAGEQGR